MFILSLNLISHICRHVLQGSKDASHPLHVLLHLHLAVVIGDPEVEWKLNVVTEVRGYL